MWAIWDAIGDQAFPQAGTQATTGHSAPYFIWECALYSGAQPVTNLSVSVGDTVYVETSVGSFSGGTTMHFFYENLSAGTFTDLYEACGSFSTAPAAAWFSHEVNQNLGIWGWGTFNEYQVQSAAAYSSLQGGYINNFNYIQDLIQYNSTEIASPGDIDSYGDYYMCNC